MSSDTREQGRQCAHCEQQVTPVEKRGGVLLFTLVMLLTLAAVIACIVNAVHAFTSGTVHGPAVAVLWPVALADTGWAHPTLFAVVAAVVSFLAAAWVCGKLSQHAERTASCPQCRRRLGAAAPAPTA